jgi:hypothetical protein
MKREYFWFFVLILAAAMVVGFTLGVMLNFKYISQQIIATQKQQAAQEAYARIQPSGSALESEITSSTAEKSSTTTQATTTQTNNTQTSANAKQQTSTSVPSGQSSSNTSEDKLMIVSPAEKQEIEAMFNTAGIPANQDYSQRVRSFQETIGLPSTGIMDSQTLQTLIKITTVHKANQQLGQ